MERVFEEPSAPTHEFLIYRQGQAWWTDAWIVTPAKEPPGSQAIQIKHHWWTLANHGPHKGQLVKSKQPMMYRWLRSPEERARLRVKAQPGTTIDTVTYVTRSNEEGKTRCLE